MSLFDVLKQYADPASPQSGNVLDHFDQAANASPLGDLGRGVAAALRSDATPSFGQSVGGLFNQSNPEQRAGLLNELLRSLPPGALAGVAGGVLGQLAGALGAGNAVPPTVTPDQASQVSPADVSAIATHAENHDGSIVDKVGVFYAAHPQLVKSLGAAALAVVLGRMHTQA